MSLLCLLPLLIGWHHPSHHLHPWWWLWNHPFEGACLAFHQRLTLPHPSTAASCSFTQLFQWRLPPSLFLAPL
eukprot:12999925-Ditylum_brightwellii.AAC.1